MPVTLILLLLASAILTKPLLPLGIGLLSISMALGAAALLAHFLHLSILVQNLATMLGLGTRHRLCIADGEPVSRSIGRGA